MQKPITLLAVLALTLPLVAQNPCGDCNGNGTGPDILDALTGAQYAAGLIAPPAPAECDVNNSGSVDIIDALAMAQAGAGLPVMVMCPGGGTTCSITSPSGTTECADVDLVFNVTTMMATVDLDFDVSTDGGTTFAPAATAASSMLSNPATGVTPGMGLTYTLDSAMITAMGMAAVTARVTVDGTVTCTTTFDIDNPCASGGPRPPVAGDMLFTEVMQNPDVVPDNMGEWFEMQNVSMDIIDLEGCTISDAGSDTHLIANGGPLLVMPGDWIVFGTNANMATNGNVPVDYEYGTGFFLANGADELILTNPSMVEVVRIEWDGGPVWPDPIAATMNLDPAITSPMAANNGTNWCQATMFWAAGSERGSPGAMNETCP